MKIEKLLLALLVVATAAAPVPAAVAAGAPETVLRASVNVRDALSLQRGAHLFVHYCMGCHSANFMRYNRLTDIGLTEQQIRDFLMFTTDRVGSTMSIPMRPADAKEWFGKTPPDLSVIARSKRPDYLYSLLMTYYVDDSRPLGWNNLQYPNIGMPNPFWQLQGNQRLEGAGEGAAGPKRVVLDQPGTMTELEYRQAVTDLVNFLVYMGEPGQVNRVRIGILVMFFLTVALVLVVLLKREFWRDVH